MVIRVQAELELEPGSMSHQAWFNKVCEVLATAPDGAAFTMKEPFTPREVHVEEFIQYLLTDKTYHSYSATSEARRMWGILVRVCGDQLGVAVPGDRVEATTFPLPLLALKRLMLVHFEITHTTAETRERFLKFVEGLH